MGEPRWEVKVRSRWLLLWRGVSPSYFAIVYLFVAVFSDHGFTSKQGEGEGWYVLQNPFKPGFVCLLFGENHPAYSTVDVWLPIVETCLLKWH